MNGGVKHDEKKSRMDLLDPEFLLEMGRTMTYGAEKYEDRNWERGISYSRLYAAILRHTLKFWKGETFDRDSGLKALAHVAANAMMLASMAETWDDRPEYVSGIECEDEGMFDSDDEVVFINVDREDQAELEEYLKDDGEEHTTIVVEQFTLPTGEEDHVVDMLEFLNGGLK